MNDLVFRLLKDSKKLTSSGVTWADHIVCQQPIESLFPLGSIMFPIGDFSEPFGKRHA